MTPALVLRPPAKINLTLRVGSARPDGFHDVRSVLQSIALSDRLTIAAQHGPMTLDVRPPVAPAGPANLVWRAATLLWKALERKGEPHGLRLTLEKAIPSAAGLGGASADAAAALVGLHALWRGRLPRRALFELASALGSDVPFFLVGGTALALGRGEDVVPLADVRALRLVLVKPAFDVATPDAYRWLDEDAGARAAASSAPPAVDVGWPTDPLLLINDLQQPVSRRHPEIVDVIEALRTAGARATLMSGSGSAAYGVFDAPPPARALNRLARPGWTVISTRTLSRRQAERRVRLC